MRQIERKTERDNYRAPERDRYIETGRERERERERQKAEERERERDVLLPPPDSRNAPITAHYGLCRTIY